MRSSRSLKSIISHPNGWKCSQHYKLTREVLNETTRAKGVETIVVSKTHSPMRHKHTYTCTYRYISINNTLVRHSISLWSSANERWWGCWLYTPAFHRSSLPVRGKCCWHTWHCWASSCPQMNRLHAVWCPSSGPGCMERQTCLSDSRAEYTLHK